MDILYLWLRATALLTALAVLFGFGPSLIAAVRGLWRSRIVRSDLRRHGISCPQEPKCWEQLVAPWS